MKRGLLPGTFDPPTIGHFDLIERASKLCERLIVGISISASKRPLFALEERLKMVETLCQQLTNVSVTTFEGLSTEFVKAEEISVVFRGLRRAGDLEREIGLAIATEKLTGCQTLVLLHTGIHNLASSTLVREIGQAGGDLKPFVPKTILNTVSRLLKKH